MRQLIRTVVVVAACATAVSAQRRVEQGKIPGEWGPAALQFTLPNPGDGLPIPPADSAGMAAAFDRIASIIKRAPALNPLLGVQGRFWADPADWLVERPYKGPLPVRAVLGFINMFQDCPICPIQLGSEATVAFSIFINDPGTLCNFLDDGRDGMAIGAAPAGRTYGLPTYRLYESRLLVLTHITRPMFVRVTQEEYLRRRITEVGRDNAEVQEKVKLDPGAELAHVRTETEAAIAQMEKIDPKLAKQMRAELAKSLKDAEAELAASAAQNRADRARAGQSMNEMAASVRAELDDMTPEQRKAPAYAAGASDRVSGLSDAKDPNAQPVVKLNLQFFDRTMPSSAVQLIVIKLPPPPDELREGETDHTPFIIKLARRIVDTVEWKALLAEVRP